MGHPLRNFWYKDDQVMSGHGAMTSQEVQGQAVFARNSGIWHIRLGDIEASFDYFRSELT